MSAAPAKPQTIVRLQDAALRRYFARELLPQTRARAAALRALAEGLEHRLAMLDPERDLHRLGTLVLAVDAIEAAAAAWFDLSTAA